MSVLAIVIVGVAVLVAPLAGLLLLTRYLLGGSRADGDGLESIAPVRLGPGHVWRHVLSVLQQRPRRIGSGT